MAFGFTSEKFSGKVSGIYSNIYNGQLFLVLYIYFNLLNSFFYLLVKRIDKNNFLSNWSKNNFVSVDSLGKKSVLYSICNKVVLSERRVIFNVFLKLGIIPYRLKVVIFVINAITGE